MSYDYDDMKISRDGLKGYLGMFLLLFVCELISGAVLVAFCMIT